MFCERLTFLIDLSLMPDKILRLLFDHLYQHQNDRSIAVDQEIK